MHFELTVGISIFYAIGCGGPSDPSPAADERPSIQFTRLDAERTGIEFVNRLPENHPRMNIVEYQYYYNGSGLAVGDVNGDDLPDLYFAANIERDRLYLNRGDLRFEDVTDPSGVGRRPGWSNGVSMVDIDADGDLDIYVARAGRVQEPLRANELLINDGTGTFRDQARKYGLADVGNTQHAVFFDYDLDGDLDAYVLNFATDSPDPKADLATLVKLRDPLAGDRLYRNDEGRFVDVSEGAGISGSPLGFGLSATVADFNSDGYPDIYVCNDFTEHDYFYVNQGDGTFVDELKESMPHTSWFSMGSDGADIDNDGLIDVLVSDMAAPDNYRQKTMMLSMNVPRFRRMVEGGFHYQYVFNTLQRNNGDGTFSDIAQLAGIARTDWSWSALAADLDNDGWRDIFVTNGRVQESTNVDTVYRRTRYELTGGLKGDRLVEFLETIPDGRVANLVFRNQGALRFEDVSASSGLDWVGASNGAAYADLDRDGDLDFVINNVDDPALVFENRARETADHHYLRIALNGPADNPIAIGARVTVTTGELTQLAEHQLVRGYMSSVEPGLHFGLGEASTVDELVVRWPNGRQQVLADVPADQTLTLNYRDSGPPAASADPPAPSFAEVTEASGVAFRHRENAFDDLAREVLLPYETSKLGPALAVGDVQGDGLDDLYIGGAMGQSGVLFVQDASGRFRELPGPWRVHADREDVAATFFDADGDGDLDLYVGSGGNEPAPDAPELQDRLYLNDGDFHDASDRLPEVLVSTGAVASGDVDGDGDADLFVGGRLVPGRYPLPPRSYVLRNEGGRFVDATEAVAPSLANPGLVTDARFADLDGDNDADLVVVGEWMPVIVATNEGGVLSAAPLADSEGWWRSVTVVEGPEGPQLVTGNVGRNLKFRASLDEPFRVYAKDFDNTGTLDIVLAMQQEGTEYPVRGRECSSQQMPFIAEKFVTYDAYGSATLRDVYGDDLDTALALRAKTFDSSVWTRDGGEWRRQPLPMDAQIGTVAGTVVHDVDQDGRMDLVVAGNLEKTEVETPRIDGGTGLVLLASASGDYRPVLPRDSGFSARGDVKGLAKLRLADGPGVVVVRNDGPASVFRMPDD